LQIWPLLPITFFHYVDGSETEREDEMEHPEKQLFIARVSITLLSAFIIVFFTSRLLNGTIGRLLDKMSGKQMFTDKNQKDSSSSIAPQAYIFVIIITAVFWKVVLICTRLYLLYLIVRSLFKHGGLVEEVKKKVQWVEFLLYFDLMLSGIPLGVVTFMELFIFNEEPFQFGSENALELMKLGALMVDLVGASFLFWYIVVGLIHKISCLHHEHEGGHHGHHKDESHDKLLGNDDHNHEHSVPARKNITVHISVNTSH